MKSPSIKSIKWGEIEVEGLGKGKDFKLYPGGGRAWDWSETNTHHIPGIQILDAMELLENNSEQIVLSRGMLLKLEMCSETKDFLEQVSIQFHVMETKMAVEFYNHLVRQNVMVGGLFHSTC
jgi:hypothetical protein